MHGKLHKNLKLLLNREVIRRNLIRYFRDQKGFSESFRKKVYPPMVADVGIMVPGLHDKVEIVPFVESVDPVLGSVKLGWNLFVLGNHRIYLGETYHTDSNQLKQAVYGGQVTLSECRGTYEHSAKTIIEFIMKVLSANLKCLKTLPTQSDLAKAANSPFVNPQGGLGYAGSFYGKSGGGHSYR